MSESKEKNNIKEIIIYLECTIEKVEENNKILQTKIRENNELLQELKKELNNLKNQSNNCQNTKCLSNSTESEGNNDLNSDETFSTDNKNLNESEKLTKKDSFNDINNFNYISINQELNIEMKKLFENNIIKKEVKVNSMGGGLYRKLINEENKDIKSKLNKQLRTISNKEKNYILKKANFFKKIGKIVRFSHEMGIYIFQLLLEIFKDKIGIHSSLEEKVRLYFATWIKKSLNENIFKKMIKIENIKKQLNNLIKLEEKEKDFIYDLFIDLSKLYFQCHLTDIIVQIIYANKDELFDLKTMEDNLTGNEDEKNVLFTYLPGLCVDGQFFENSQIYVVTYPIKDPKKFDIEQFEFKKIEAKIKIPVNNIIKKIENIEIKFKKVKNEKKFFKVKFEINLGVNIPEWDSIKYKFILKQCNNFEWEGEEQTFSEEINYGLCKLEIFINSNFFKQKDFILDLSKKN